MSSKSCMFFYYQIRAASQPAENLTARGTARLNEVASSWLEKAHLFMEQASWQHDQEKVTPMKTMHQRQLLH